MKLINYNEVLVREKLEELLKDSTFCTCEQCKLDMMAIALNNLPPKYVVTEQGEVYSKAQAFNAQNAVDILGAVTNAIEKVKRSPRH
ncbi:competence protein ComFB [Anaerobranca californiensis DSM 14826]|jgi:competence protein ComFB|uniref:Competence protein ComFB n=1 Tax=Anaerobranca californiensis DSM 14826 TaxID=1120989 RepID=A0A1M6LBX2_9FIRM|nr:late competence development ComFB family protein [Anaerobranca californiensis]SHJ68673.1 competence protein ComFB [Anaerobranca californiensis DSM 14826]